MTPTLGKLYWCWNPNLSPAYVCENVGGTPGNLFSRLDGQGPTIHVDDADIDAGGLMLVSFASQGPLPPDHLFIATPGSSFQARFEGVTIGPVFCPVSDHPATAVFTDTQGDTWVEAQSIVDGTIWFLFFAPGPPNGGADIIQVAAQSPQGVTLSGPFPIPVQQPPSPYTPRTG